MTTVVVGVDNGEASTRAVEFAVERARARDWELLITHVIPWSPYSFNTPSENEQRHRRREEEIAAADEQLIRPMAAIAEQAGVPVRTEIHHGNPAQTLIELATSTGASHIIVGRTGDSGFRETIFGSCASRLAQSAPVPVTVVP